jgi:hypothetical protein
MAEKKQEVFKMIIGNNTQISQKPLQTSIPAENKDTEPKDNFEKSGYVDNLKNSSLAGFAAGFIKVGNAVDHFMPSVDGLDHTGLHILYAMPAIVSGTVAGVLGGAAGFVVGLFGGNIKNFVEIPQT